jgi:hypothetical protein
MFPDDVGQSSWHDRLVRLWATYSKDHPEVDIYGDHEGLLALANTAAQPDLLELALDDPPPQWQKSNHPLRSIRVAPRELGDTRIYFAREGSAFVMSGSADELARIVAESIASLAGGPAKRSGVGSHVHLDPTSDPDRQFYAPDSISVVVGFADSER